MKSIVEVALIAVISIGFSSGGDSVGAAQTGARSLPPMGMFTSCEIDTVLTTNCEQQDLAMRQIGLTWEANFIGIAAHKTGPGSLQEWFTYDASIGMNQAIVIKHAIDDPVDALRGDNLIRGFNNSLATDCGATNNQQIISCIASVASGVSGFHYMWDIYDEPGCPNRSIGYCAGTLAGGRHNNVATLAKYIHSIDPTHGIFGVNVGDCCGSNGSSEQTVLKNLYSWLAIPPATSTGFDYYPIPEGTAFGKIADIGTDATGIARVIQANNPGMRMNVTMQAFSWLQEGGKGCASIAVCPYPTESQMQSERDQVLYYAFKARQPISVMWWYYWPDIICENTYPGCSSTANQAALKSAMTAPFPAKPPRSR
jgi:hypothetical protein